GVAQHDAPYPAALGTRALDRSGGADAPRLEDGDAALVLEQIDVRQTLDARWGAQPQHLDALACAFQHGRILTSASRGSGGSNAIDALIARAELVRQWLQAAAGCECPSLDDCPLFDPHEKRA